MILGLAAGKMWDRIQWGRASRDGVPEKSFFSLSSATGVWGLVKIVWYGFKPRNWTKRDHALLWSLARLFAIACLMAPGLFIMSKITQKVIYYPVPGVPSQSIVGGMGTYSPSLATNYSNSYTGIPALIQVLLRDPSTSIPVSPISPYCLASSSSCVSYLLPGGLSTVFP
ncbi:uncharacterized protein LY89DRAFT_158628 [Mollisia scopiformis]|uniref:Uncharacterized protein n=1 Tax=Mollisia scopiformis TaxID=149040 RepID=A0A194WZU4_MOLSC|nr:uncharacterized protein LY89DRAFT_158628 [Mollisia scopiformis]KUJ13461.1 hypothetical protein LY89DRAFT_158628 [Mollisia scopiformis]